MAHEVFISYSSKDKPTADALCAKLEGHGLRCWIAPRDVLPGVPYGESIVDAIQNSRLMVLIFSSDSNRSQQVMREVERAVSKSVPILPFRIEDVPLSPSMEYFISAPHWLDALSGPLEEHLERLAATADIIFAKGASGARKVGDAPPAQPWVRTSPVVNPSPAKFRLTPALAGLAILVLILGGGWSLFKMLNKSAAERQSAQGGVTQPAPSSANAGQKSSESPSVAAPNAARDASAVSDTEPPRPAGTTRGKVGAELTDGRWRFQLLDFKQARSYTMKRTTETDYAMYHTAAEFDNNTLAPKSGNTLLVFDCRIVNDLKQKQALLHYDNNTAVLSDLGESHPPIAVDIRGGGIQSDPLLPGSKLEFSVIFAVPQGTKPKELIFTLKNIDDKEGTDVHVLL